MKKAIILVLLATISCFGFSQDRFGFKHYEAENDSIIASGNFPEVVFMGNSITEYWMRHHPDFFTTNNFCGRGISAQTSTQMLVRFTADVVHLHPKVVVIMAGTNDVAHNDCWVAPEIVVDNIVAMCVLAKANGIIPIISSILPCSEIPWRKSIQNPGQTIVDINTNLKNYAEANGLVYVDYHTALADENLGLPKTLSKDGCHPIPNTYFIMEDIVLEAISAALKQ